MAPKITRRQLFSAGVVVVIGYIATEVLIIRRGTRQDPIRDNIYAQINRAGWRNAKPEIYSVKGKANTYLTGSLPVAGGCGVRLIFTGDGSGEYRVEYCTTSDPGEYVFSARGEDGKQYPDALKELRNPTKQQLDRMLTAAGVTLCKPLPRE